MESLRGSEIWNRWGCWEGENAVKREAGGGRRERESVE